VVGDAREDGRVYLEASKCPGGAKELNEGRVDPGARSLVGRPVERNAFRLGVVAPGVRREVAGPDEEQPDVSATDAHDRPASAQQAVDHCFRAVHLDRPAVGADEDRAGEALGGS
jgi:hypothetical protein